MFKATSLSYDCLKNLLFFQAVDDQGNETTQFFEHKRSIEHIQKLIKQNGVIASDDHGQLLHSIAKSIK